MVAVDGNVKRSVQLLDAAVPALRTVNDRQKPPAHVESLLTVAASTAPLGAGVGVATCTGACQPPPAVASNTHISTPLGHGVIGTGAAGPHHGSMGAVGRDVHGRVPPKKLGRGLDIRHQHGVVTCTSGEPTHIQLVIWDAVSGNECPIDRFAIVGCPHVGSTRTRHRQITRLRTAEQWTRRNKGHF